MVDWLFDLGFSLFCCMFLVGWLVVWFFFFLSGFVLVYIFGGMWGSKT